MRRSLSGSLQELNMKKRGHLPATQHVGFSTRVITCMRLRDMQVLEGFEKRTNRAVFTDVNATLITAGEDGFVRRWDVEVR